MLLRAPKAGACIDALLSPYGTCTLWGLFSFASLAGVNVVQQTPATSCMHLVRCCTFSSGMQSKPQRGSQRDCWRLQGRPLPRPAGPLPGPARPAPPRGSPASECSLQPSMKGDRAHPDNSCSDCRMTVMKLHCEEQHAQLLPWCTAIPCHRCNMCLGCKLPPRLVEMVGGRAALLKCPGQC